MGWGGAREPRPGLDGCGCCGGQAVLESSLIGLGVCICTSTPSVFTLARVVHGGLRAEGLRV